MGTKPIVIKYPVIDQRFADRHIDTADGKAWPIVFEANRVMPNQANIPKRICHPRILHKEYTIATTHNLWWQGMILLAPAPLR